MTASGWLAGSSGLLCLVSAAAWLRRRLLVVTVEGQSMQPTLQAGQRLLVRRIRSAIPLHASQIVVVTNTGRSRPPAQSSRSSSQNGLDVGPPYLVKRLVALPGGHIPDTFNIPNRTHPTSLLRAGDLVPTGHIVLLGDNQSASYDSRHEGYFPESRLVGYVVRNLSDGRPPPPASIRFSDRHALMRPRYASSRRRSQKKIGVSR